MTNKHPKKKKTVFLIPALSDNEIIKKKNIRLLSGRPLISYVIQAAKQTELPIYVASDCETTLYYAEEKGCIPYKVNNQIMQNGSTKNMIFKPEYIVYYLSKFMTLMPGDIIPTGTPPGVGMGQKPPVFLKKGDVMELEIENLGKQKQKVF